MTVNGFDDDAEPGGLPSNPKNVNVGASALDVGSLLKRGARGDIDGQQDAENPVLGLGQPPLTGNDGAGVDEHGFKLRHSLLKNFDVRHGAC